MRKKYFQERGIKVFTKAESRSSTDGYNILARDILHCISQNIKEILVKISPDNLKDLQEIRLRANKPVMIVNSSGDWFISGTGGLSRYLDGSSRIDSEEILKTLELMSENSIYAFQDDIRNGFITLAGGHRVGIAGKVVLENGIIKNIKDISALNIRICREVKGCSKKVIKYILNSGSVYNTMIISPPQCGKTTMLRDIARAISNGIPEYNFKGVKVGIIDERSEIAACYRGVPQNDVGVRTDVMDTCPKKLGMELMLRSMSPQVLITDEIGNQGDAEAVAAVLNSGVKIITAAHGYNISELRSRYEVIKMIERKIFERFIVLSGKKGPGTVEEIIDGSTMEVRVRNVS
jgi:stage III sporulation protein AA